MKTKLYAWILCGSFLSLVVVYSLQAELSGEVPIRDRMVTPADMAPSIEIDEGQLQILEAWLNKHDVKELEGTIISTFMGGCPSIYSSWHCKRLEESQVRKDREKAERQRRLRKWGAAVLAELKRESVELSGPEITQEQYHSSVRRHFQLADWFMKGDGYGNYILAARCRSVAGVALAHLIVDSAIPIADLKGMALTMEKSEDKLEFYRRLIRIHEHEVPGSIAPFVKKEVQPDQARQAFLGAAVRATTLMSKDYKINFRNNLVGVDWEATRDARHAVPDQLAVYIDDPVSEYSAEKQWDRYSLIPEFSENRKLTELLSSTLLFREAVGGFPLKPLPDDAYAKDGKLNFRYSSTVHAAFSRAWTEFSQSYVFLNSDLKKDPATGTVVVDPKAENLSLKYGNMNAGTSAARLYEAVKSGQFRGYHPDDASR